MRHSFNMMSLPILLKVMESDLITLKYLGQNSIMQLDFYLVIPSKGMFKKVS